MTNEDRNLLIERFIPLANQLAIYKSRSVPKNVTLDELKSAAYMGLIQAAERFDENRSDYFEYYLRKKINWAMQDYLRFLGWKSDKVTAEYLETLPAKEDFSIDVAMDLVEKIHKRLDGVAKRMFVMYHVEHKDLKAISARFGLSLGRVSQILKKSRESLAA
jgi:RNA polymerase sigma factor (sigma-70 family)